MFLLRDFSFHFTSGPCAQMPYFICFILWERVPIPRGQCSFLVSTWMTMDGPRHLADAWDRLLADGKTDKGRPACGCLRCRLSRVHKTILSFPSLFFFSSFL